MPIVLAVVATGAGLVDDQPHAFRPLGLRDRLQPGGRGVSGPAGRPHPHRRLRPGRSRRAALWGLLISSQLQKGNGQLGLGFELDAITVVVIGGTACCGGRASVVGTVLGRGACIETIRNGLNLLNTPPAYQRISVGLLLIAALALLGLRGQTRRGRP